MYDRVREKEGVVARFLERWRRLGRGVRFAMSDQ